MFDLAGKGTLGALYGWVVAQYEMGPYADVTDNQGAANCASGICC